MPSPLITDVTSQGLQLRPIQGPGVRAQTQVAIGPLDPRYPMAANAAVFDALRLKEQQHQFDQNLSLQLQENQRKLFKDMFGQSIQSAQMAGENYGLDPMLNSHALKLQQIKQKEQEAMTNIQNAFSAATSRSGRPSATGYMDQINRTANGLQQDLLSDQEYAQMALQNRRKNDFLKQVAALEKQGYNINYADVNQAVESYYNSANDLSGQTIFNTNTFDPQQYIFDKDQADKALGEYLTGAIGETELERIVSAVELDPSLEGVDAYVTVNETVRNELGKASSLAANAILADANLVRAMRAQGYDTTRAGVEEYVKNTLEDRLAKRDIERSYTNLGDVNTYLRAQQSAQSRMDLEELQAQNRLELEREKQRTKSTESTVNIRGNRGKIDREKEPELADFIDYVDSQVDSQWTVSNQQSRDLKADLENLGISASNADIKVQDDGTLTLSYQNKAGDVKTKTYGKASKAAPKSSGSFSLNNSVPSASEYVPGDISSLLEIIDKRESGGDYGALYTFANRTPGSGFEDVDLTKMTVNEVLEFAKKRGVGSYANFVASKLPENWSGDKVGQGEFTPKRIATPMGRYQYTGTRLESVAKSAGLTGEELFTPELQDQLFNHDVAAILSKHDNMPDKVKALKGVWEGFIGVSNEQLVQAVEAFESGQANFDPNSAQVATTDNPVESKPQPLTFAEGMVATPQEISPEDYYTQVNNKLKKRVTSTYGTAMAGTANKPYYEGLSEESASVIQNYEKAVSDLEKAEETLEGVKEAQTNLAIAQQQLMENREIATSLILSETSKEKLKDVGTELADNLLNDSNSVGYNRPITANDGSQHSLQIIPISGGKIGVKILTSKGEEKTEKFGSRSEFGDYLAENYQPMLSEYLVKSLKTSAQAKLGAQSEQQSGGIDLDAIRQRRNQFKSKPSLGGESFFNTPSPDTEQTNTVSTAQRVLNNDIPDNLSVNIVDQEGNKYDLEYDTNLAGGAVIRLNSGDKKITRSFDTKKKAIKFLEDNYQVTFSPN